MTENLMKSFTGITEYTYRHCLGLVPSERETRLEKVYTLHRH